MLGLGNSGRAVALAVGNELIAEVMLNSTDHI